MGPRQLSALVELQRDVHRRRTGAGGGALSLVDKAHNARPITMDEATIVAGEEDTCKKQRLNTFWV
jgi:hypothetical protein